MAQWPRNALRETKRTLMQAHTTAINQARELEMAGMMRQVGSAENIEAVTAFFEKRAPRFD
jgi:enoyl-CoA hydratase/carnithine racemase